MRSVLLFALVLTVPQNLKAEATQHVVGSVEAGPVAVINHDIQFGKSGTSFDLRNDGNQDIWFPYYRFKVMFPLDENSGFEVSYVPLELKTFTTLNEDLVVEDTLFPAGTNLDIVYGFPFYRAGYFISRPEGPWTFTYGGALQIRNASIRFTSADGAIRKVNQNVGPVPLIRLGLDYKSGDHTFSSSWEGIYAPVAYLNGSDSDVVGSFHDVRLAWSLETQADAHAGLVFRYIGGGARGSNSDADGLAKARSYSSNWIDLLVVAVSWDKQI